jgi:uncharacterized coiled-coil protein SlyX
MTPGEVFMFKKFIEARIKQEIEKYTARPDNKLELTGFHTLSEIKGKMFEWLFVPFRGSDILVEVRYSRSTQLPEVDKLKAVIERQKNGKSLSRRDMIGVLELQYECCKVTLNRPTFEELTAAIYEKDKVIEEKKRELALIAEQIRKLQDGPERQELYRRQEDIEVFVNCVLPDDTMLAITNIALGIGLTDIRKLTTEKLLLAYQKAKLYGRDPADYVPGLFTDGDRENISNYATKLGTEWELHNRKPVKGRKAG